MNPKPVIDAIADAILDGTPIDWHSVDPEDLPDRAFVEQLKTLAALRGMQRASVSMSPGPWRWGHLQVFERIGHGAFGDVHRAWDPRLDREVALKLLRSDVLVDDGPGSAVIEEGRLLARVRHPNVVTIYGAEPIDGRIGLWMEFVKGRTLEEELRSGRTFTAAEVRRLGVDLCAAVASVHAAGLVHRDIKAQNVMLDDSGRLVLMDFGAGHEADDSTGKATAGTPLYLAPEVLSGGDATRRSDVYSIGVVLFRLLTGSYPVFGGDLADLRRAHATGDGADARLDRAGIPVRLRRVLGRAIDPDPDRRYAGADMFGAALAALERAPTITRVAYGIAGAAAIAMILTGATGWNLGLRERLSPALIALGVFAKTPTIAVLPFRNAGSDPGNDDFVDGLTSEVIRNLAGLDGLQVTSQASSFFFKERPRDLPDVAKRLQVDFVIEAAVQRVADRVRINAQLVRLPDQVVVWSQPYDRTLDDIFAIQDDISRQIVNKLRVTLGKGQRRYRTNVAAYDLYLRGLVLADLRGTEKAGEAAQIFEQVIGMDATFAPAYAGLVKAYAEMSWQNTGIPLKEALPVMWSAALKAFELDPLLPETYAAMGTTQAYALDWENARKSFDRALEYSTGTLTSIRADYAVKVLLPLGEAARAEQMLTDAMVFDPESLALRRDVGMVQFVGGRSDEAVLTLQRVIDADPDRDAFAAGNLFARALMQVGRPGEAIAYFERTSPPAQKSWERWAMPAFVKLGRDADIARVVESHRNEQPYRQALVYAALGDKDRTFEALNRAVDDVSHRVAFILACPEMALLQGDPRLQPLRKRLGLR